LWAVRRRLPGGMAVSLVNLTGLENPHWDTPHPAPSPCRDLDIHFHYPHRPTRATWSCPEQEAGPQSLDLVFEGGTIQLTLPEIHYTGLIFIHD
jgi:hypothetical protein